MTYTLGDDEWSYTDYTQSIRVKGKELRQPNELGPESITLGGGYISAPIWLVAANQLGWTGVERLVDPSEGERTWRFVRCDEGARIEVDSGASGVLTFALKAPAFHLIAIHAGPVSFQNLKLTLAD